MESPTSRQCRAGSLNSPRFRASRSRFRPSGRPWAAARRRSTVGVSCRARRPPPVLARAVSPAGSTPRPPARGRRACVRGRWWAGSGRGALGAGQAFRLGSRDAVATLRANVVARGRLGVGTTWSLRCVSAQLSGVGGSSRYRPSSGSTGSAVTGCPLLPPPPPPPPPLQELAASMSQ